MSTASRPAPAVAAAAEVSNRRHAREQEGFQRTLGDENQERYDALRCATFPFGWPWGRTADSRGGFNVAASPARRRIEWETSPAESAERTVFTWMGGSRTFPGYTAAFPYATASLTVDGGEPLPFPIGRPEGFRVERDGLVLEFEARQFHSTAELNHRTQEAL